METNDIIFTIFFFGVGLMMLFLSKSERNYAYMLEKYGKEPADKVNRRLKLCGYGLIVLVALMVLNGLDYI